MDKAQQEYDNPLAIRLVGMRKSYGTLEVLKGIDLEVSRGSVFALLGPNGAGKTTIIRILATLLNPDEGKVEVLGYQLPREKAQVRKRIALAGQYASIDEDLSGWENLILLARLLGFKPAPARHRTEEILRAFDLTDAAKRQVKTFSGGMRRKLDIAASLIITPDLLFLDEPTTGLDPHNRNEIWEIIRGLSASGTTILLTTQYLDEADQLADRIAVIDHGRVIADGSPGKLKASVGSGVLHLRLTDSNDRPQAQKLLTRFLDLPVHLSPDPVALHARVGDTHRVAPALVSLNEAGIGYTDFSMGQPSLDEVFLALTGKPVDPSNPEGKVQTQPITYQESP